MKIVRDMPLSSFQPNKDAAENFNKFSALELMQIEEIISEMHPDGIDAERLNNIFTYDFENLQKWIGKE